MAPWLCLQAGWAENVDNFLLVVLDAGTVAGMDDSELVLPDAAAWRAWLDEHESDSDGCWLVLAKKGTIVPTSLSYTQALDEALCSGWIDGRKRSRDDATFLQHFTARRPRSVWSLKNTGHVQRLRAEGRLRPRGEEEVSKAQADGRWERAYAGQKDAQVPADLQVLLNASDAAAQNFAALDSSGRYHILHQLMTASSPAARAKRLAGFAAQLDAAQE